MTGGASGKAVKATEDARAPSTRCGTRSFLAIFLLDCWIFLTLFGFAIGLGGLGLDGGVEAMTESDRPSGEGAVREISRRYDGFAAGGESRDSDAASMTCHIIQRMIQLSWKGDASS